MKRFLILATVGAAVSGGMALTHFYSWFDLEADRVAMEEKLSPGIANGIKHAYAAAEVYHLFRSVGFGPETAGSAVLCLGEMNEYAEQLVRNPPDTTQEMAKDMHNNYAGLVAASWWERSPAHRTAGLTRLDAVVMLAHGKVIAAKPDDVSTGGRMLKAMTEKRDVAAASDWFLENGNEIAKKSKQVLNKLSQNQKDSKS